MKTSILLSIALFVNTSLLLSEPLANWVQGVNPWVFVIIELTLLLGIYINNTAKDLNKACELDLDNLNVFVLKTPKN